MNIDKNINNDTPTTNIGHLANSSKNENYSNKSN